MNKMLGGPFHPNVLFDILSCDEATTVPCYFQQMFACLSKETGKSYAHIKYAAVNIQQCAPMRNDPMVACSGGPRSTAALWWTLKKYSPVLCHIDVAFPKTLQKRQVSAFKQQAHALDTNGNPVEFIALAYPFDDCERIGGIGGIGGTKSVNLQPKQHDEHTSATDVATTKCDSVASVQLHSCEHFLIVCSMIVFCAVQRESRAVMWGNLTASALVFLQLVHKSNGPGIVMPCSVDSNAQANAVSTNTAPQISDEKVVALLREADRVSLGPLRSGPNLNFSALVTCKCAPQSSQSAQSAQSCFWNAGKCAQCKQWNALFAQSAQWLNYDLEWHVEMTELVDDEAPVNDEQEETVGAEEDDDDDDDVEDILDFDDDDKD